MPVSGQNIVDAARTISDLKLSRFLLDSPDLIGMLNDILSETYDALVAEREGYFKQTVSLSFDSPGTFTGFVQDVPGLSVEAAGNVIALANPNVDPAKKYKISNLTITPTLANLGNECSLTLYVNGQPTNLSCVIRSGHSTPPETDSHSVIVAMGDVFTLVTAPSDPTAIPGSPWGFDLSFNVDPIQIQNVYDLPRDFYKELEIWTGSIPGQNRIFPLDSYHDRGTKNGYWLSGRTIEFYPQNVAVQTPVNMDYVPECPVITLTQNIPIELERFRELLEVALAMKIRETRQQQISLTMQATFDRLSKRIKRMSTGRKSAPRSPAIPESDKYYGDYRRRRYPLG